MTDTHHEKYFGAADAKWLVAYRSAMFALMAVLLTFVSFIGKALIDNTALNALAIASLQERISAQTTTLQAVAAASFTGHDAAAVEARQRVIDAAQDIEIERHDRRITAVEAITRTRGLDSGK